MATDLQQGLARFGQYVAEVESLATLVLKGTVPSQALLRPELDGRSAAEVRIRVSRAARRASGIFFTGSELRSQAVPHGVITPGIATDPACGAGDLLLAAAGHLPVATSLEATVKSWGNRLAGADLQDAFVRLARARLVLLAHSRIGRSGRGTLPLEQCFPYLARADATAHLTRQHHTTLLMNPPFGLTTAPSNCSWGSGRVSEAAVFLEKCLTSSPTGTQVSAILPDVLRSGSRYTKWRSRIQDLMSVSAVSTAGRFDIDADVHVFVLRGVVGQPSPALPQWWPHSRSIETVKDHYRVSVGPVVPHRDPEDGPLLRYLHARLVSGKGRYADTDEMRPYAGRTFTPPFVVVPRTSRPNDGGARLWATVVEGRGPVAVENHLLILEPLSGGLQACRSVADLLQAPETTYFLDQRLRCRHLTTPAIREVPWPMPEAAHLD